jgi:glucokinase-like ROK family protein
MSVRIKTSSRLARELSRAEVLNVIRAESPISRIKLAQMVTVSRATVSGIVSELLEVGVLEEAGEDPSTGGRRPIKLRYRPESRMAVGVVLFDNQIQAVLADMEGNPLKFLTLSMSGTAPEDMLDCMKDAVEQLLTDVPREWVLGVGVGVPGVVDFSTGIIEISVGRGWLKGDIRVKEILETELGLPVYVANRSRVAALGEFQSGIGRGVSNLVYLFLGQGIAAGIVIDGQLYFGSGSSTGEIGHVSIIPDGPLCDCGNHGCLEVYATEAAILARARALARDNRASLLHQVVDSHLERLTIEQVVAAAQRGDESAVEVFTDAGSKVGMAVSTLINLFNPEMVIIGGPVGVTASQFLLDPVIKEAQRRTLSRALKMTRIVTGILGTKAVAIGSAVLAINHTPVDVIFGK